MSYNGTHLTTGGKDGDDMTREAQATTLHSEGCNCAQSVLSVFAEDFQCDKPLALRIATGFGGGMGRMGGSCGAVTGAFMVLGLAKGMRRAEDASAKETTYALAREFAERFKAKHGALLCRDLLGVDLGTPEGYAAARERNLFATRCNGYIEDAVRILEDMLEK
jgi:C_GCAxxG_C_C family probable redox protein